MKAILLPRTPAAIASAVSGEAPISDRPGQHISQPSVGYEMGQPTRTSTSAQAAAWPAKQPRK